jgi:heme exporter protein A
MTQPWILFEQVSLIRGERLILKDLTFSLRKGDVIFLKGVNGSGKSTTLQLCAQILHPHSGKITFSPQVPVAYLGHRNGLKRELTVLQNLIFFAQLLGLRHRKDMIHSLLAQLGLTAKKDVPLGYLSCGQQRRVALARLLLHPSKLWLLDEPVSNLDEQTIHWFTEKLLDHQENGGAALIACHTTLNIPHAHEVCLGHN